MELDVKGDAVGELTGGARLLGGFDVRVQQAAFAAKRATRLVYERCAEHECVVIAPSGHRLARKRRVTWPELSGERWIMSEPALLSRQALENQFVRAGAPVPEPEVVSNNPATNVQLVAAGVGFASVPLAMAQAEAEAEAEAEASIGRVARLRVDLTPPRVPTALVYRASDKRDAALEQLRRALAPSEAA